MDIFDTVIHYRNKEASSDLVLGVSIQAETDMIYAIEQLNINIQKDVEWLIEQPENEKLAIICGSSPSLKNYIDQIRERQSSGAVIYACNTAARFLASHGITPDFQVILDPQNVLIGEFEPSAKAHFLASIAYPPLFGMAKKPILWNYCSEPVINALSDVKKDFTYIGGGVSVSMSAICIAYTLGHRSIECYGIDSSYGESFHADGRTLDSIDSGQLRVRVDHAGRSFMTTWDMKQQVVVFLPLAQALKQKGVNISVYGDGLLPHAYKSSTGEVNV